MSRYPGTQKLMERSAERSTRQDTANRITTKATPFQLLQSGVTDIQDTLTDNDLAQNDNIPPAIPTGVSVTALSRSLAVSWAQPPTADNVVVTEIEVTPAGHSTEIFKARTRDGAFLVMPTVLNQDTPFVDPMNVTVRVRHVDRWGLVSEWYAAGTVSPGTSTVDYLIADRILAGTINALVSIGSQGYIHAGPTNAEGVRLDATGVTLNEAAGGYTDPASAKGSKITPRAAMPWAAISFHRANNRLGSHIRADSVGSEMPQHRFEAVYASDPAHLRSARIVISTGDVQQTGLVEIVGDLHILAQSGGGGNVTFSNNITGMRGAHFVETVRVGPLGSATVAVIGADGRIRAQALTITDGPILLPGLSIDPGAIQFGLDGAKLKDLSVKNTAIISLSVHKLGDNNEGRKIALKLIPDIPWSKVKVSGVVFYAGLNDRTEAIKNWVKKNFASKGHNHDARYSRRGHNHDARYAKRGHSH